MDAITAWWVTAGACALLFVLTLFLHRADPRKIGPEGVWVKPLKFQASLALHFATLALIGGLLSAEARGSALLVLSAWAAIAATVFELAYIMRQASRAEGSHFNLSTPYHRAMYGLMAAGAFLITVAAGILGVLVHASGEVPRILSVAILHGLLGGSVLTLITAFRIGGRLSPHVGEAPADAPRMRLTGWSLAAGDLRVAHFLALHMMQALPLFGLVVMRLAPGPEAETFIWLASALWMSWTMAEFRRALAGRPMLLTRFAPAS